VKHFFIIAAKAILKLALDKTLEKALPKIYQELDTRLPVALFNGASPKIVESEIEHVVKKVTGKPATKDIVDLVVTMYSPVKNAERVQRRHR